MPIISLARPVSLPPVGDAAAATDGAVPTLRALGGPYATAEEEDGRVLCRGGEVHAALLTRTRTLALTLTNANPHPHPHPHPHSNPNLNPNPTLTLTLTLTLT